jgi:hypothetical protein
MKTDCPMNGCTISCHEFKKRIFGIALILAIIICASSDHLSFAATSGIQSKSTNMRIKEPNVDIYGLHTVPDIVRVKNTFRINATVLNNSTNKINLDFLGCGGSPLSAVFDKNIKIEKGVCNVMFVGHTIELEPQKAVTVSGPDYLTIYRAIKSGSTTANVTLNYHIFDTSNNGVEINASKSKTFMFNVCLCLPPSKPR